MKISVIYAKYTKIFIQSCFYDIYHNGKNHSQVCYTAGCNNYATITLKLPLGSRIHCVILVCEACLPKYELDYGNTIHQRQVVVRDDNGLDAVKI
jgi:hypothetical protein